MKHIKLFEEYSKGEETIVYLHGLDAIPGPKSEWLIENYNNVFAPDIDYRKDGKPIFNTIYNQIKDMNVSLIIGSSMGGYLGYWLCKKMNVPGLLFNPALYKRSIEVSVETNGKYNPQYDIVIGSLDDVLDPVLNKSWLSDNNTNYELHEENIGHKIPIDIFQKHVKLCTGTHSPLDEKSGDTLHPVKNKWIKIDPKKHKELSVEFFDLISSAYADIGGHSKINKPEDVFSDPDWSFWSGVDIHGSPDLDLIVWGQNTKYGVKFSGVGHDGEKDTKKEYLERKAKDLSKLGYYNEVSGKLAEILINKYHVPIVEDPEEVKKLIPTMLEFHGEHPDKNTPGNGWYTRMIGGKKHIKIVVGRPKNI